MTKTKTKPNTTQRLLTVQDAEAASREAERTLMDKYLPGLLAEVDALILKGAVSRHAELRVKRRGLTEAECEALVDQIATSLKARGFDVLLDDDFLLIDWEKIEPKNTKKKRTP